MTLQEATREQLIDELFSRPGFMGVLVYFTDEILNKLPGKDSEVTTYYSLALTSDGVVNLLASAVDEYRQR
jgi:hypothetical protein